MVPRRSRKLSARTWWLLLPFEGYFGYRDKDDPRPPLWVYPLAWLWRLNDRLFSPAPFEPTPPIACDCDYCRGVPGAVFEP